MMLPSEWRALNCANWDEKTRIHLTSPKLHYRLDDLRDGTARLDPIAFDVLGPVTGMRVLHLQCHFGQDTLTIAQQGAEVVGLDFSPVAVTAARALAEELDLSDRARFVEADVYDAVAAVAEPMSFDRVFVSWGAIIWLPDLRPWARVVASFLKPEGYLALAEVHPAAFVFDDRTGTADGRPGWYAPYLAREPLQENNPVDYADPAACIMNSRTVEFLHPLSDMFSALIDAGLRITWFREHDSIVWSMFRCLVQRASYEYVWPDRPWFPLSFSRETLRVLRPGGRYLFNVWDHLAGSVLHAAAEVVARFIERDPFTLTSPPYHDIPVVEAELIRAGFTDARGLPQPGVTEVESARRAAVITCHGSVLRTHIDRHAPGRLDEITDAAADAIAARFGRGPIRAPRNAVLFTAVRPGDPM